MSRFFRWITLGSVLLCLGLVPAPASARSSTKVEWTKVDLPAGDAYERAGKKLKKLLREASRKADFGKAKKVKLRAKVTELTYQQKGDILRISCTVVGRVEGTASAKSRISFGGDPNDRDGLENQVLKLVASGLVSRLAAIARTDAAKKEAAKKAAKKEAEDL